ncbi:class I SAM-dependent methyltransferase [Pararcticibacter amylolyticus]|uniref:Methyltransferase domain-containing protein n=1 Tax=Pararcticibacter amylolyticus TaxID=2173175 RepID=A0A2U2PG31_9SPHI|nr:class I SAM-dependent methyltransferase [Pararcticibacter amylolyticus]PWG80222.1 hypothetical protein DDR33_13595 [Pararcticibacter amylolyticus]
MEHTIYRDSAYYYSQITNDRDFSAQVDFLLKQFPPEHPCSSLLELFAGQALHAIEAQKWGIDAWAIDNSKEMKPLAIEGGFSEPAQYILGDLPGAISECRGKTMFDCILCLYHGFSNLSMHDAYNLIINLKSILNPGGRIFVETQNVALLMDRLSAPGIRMEELDNSGDEVIKYAWPGGPIRWDPYSFTADVPVQLIISSSGSTRIREFISQEHMYSAENLLFLASLLGLEGRVLTDSSPGRNSFPGSVLLELSYS